MKRNSEAISASVSKSIKTKLLRMAKRNGHALSAEIRVALETWDVIIEVVEEGNKKERERAEQLLSREDHYLEVDEGGEDDEEE